MGNIWSKKEEHSENQHAEGAEAQDAMSSCQKTKLENWLQKVNESKNITSSTEKSIFQENLLETLQHIAKQLMWTHQDKLHQSRKLVLMVDLDNTLIHNTAKPRQCSPEKNIFEVNLEGLPTYYVRLRPYYKEFLQKISELFELNIFTFANRSYAKTVAGFLDPDNTLFGDRIITRDECFNMTSKMANVRFFCPCGDSMICMIDDREDVWNFTPGLVAVKPYTYFKDQKPDFHSRKDADKVNQDGDDNDDYLLYLGEMLQQIHREYYSRYDAYLRKEIFEMPNVSKVVRELRSKTLAGTTIVFSGVAPQNQWIPEYHLAEALGAKIEENVVLSFESPNWTTHLISAKSRTKKFLKAENDQNICIVSPNWLWCCWYRWEKAEEILFGLEEYVPEEAKRRKYSSQRDATCCEQNTLPPTDFVKHVLWLLEQRQDLIESLILRAKPVCPQPNYTVNPSNNYQEPQHHGVKRKRPQTEEENFNLLAGEEMLPKTPRLEAPPSTYISESVQRSNHEVQGAANQPDPGPNRGQPHTLSRRERRRLWFQSKRRQWPKNRAQDYRAQPPRDRWPRSPTQNRGHSHLDTGFHPSPFYGSHEPQGPNFPTYGYSTQMNQQIPEAGFRMPLLQDPGTGFTQPVQQPLGQFDQEYRAIPQCPARPWQQQQQAPLDAAQIPHHLSYMWEHGARPTQYQHQNHMFGGWGGPSAMM